MKVTGFSFIKDATTYDYPVLEAIRSILPICDEFVVAVGKSNDNTIQLINSLDSSKIKIIETIWDETQREGGRVLALETDKAFQHISSESDWAFYIQGDEVVHECYLDTIQQAMQTYKDDLNVDGLLFNYIHFYGSYDYIATASNFYKKEVRIIRNDKSFYSYKDAQGFRKLDNEKLHVIQINAFMYHYGWVKQPKAMQAKQENFNKLWHDDTWIEKNIAKADEFDYSKIKSLETFKGSHPMVMKERIKNQNWTFDFELSYNRKTIKDQFKDFLFKYFKVDINYKNYELIE